MSIGFEVFFIFFLNYKRIKKILNKGTYYRFDEELVIPIIENTPFEEDLQVWTFFNIAFILKIKNQIKGEHGQSNE